MSAIVCPTCGATGDQHCSTVRGNDHRKRMLLEIAEGWPAAPATESETRCPCMTATDDLHPVEPCPIHGRSVR